MDIEAFVARIYGTEDQYGAEPRKRPDGAPIVLGTGHGRASRLRLISAQSPT